MILIIVNYIYIYIYERQTNASVVGRRLIHSIAFGNQSSFEYNFALFVALVLFGGELIDPTEFGVAVLAGDVAHHMASGQHHSVLHFTINRLSHQSDISDQHILNDNTCS